MTVVHGLLICFGAAVIEIIIEQIAWEYKYDKAFKEFKEEMKNRRLDGKA
jgi:hypothetical protein